jgi:4-diphosphocytidyl-2-C-methyl-D-erythritol kinase
MHVVTRAPAKVNLCLLIGPRDDTGYHELFTVFAPIDVYDELDFTLEARRSGGRPGELHVKCHAIDGEANLLAQALRVLERETGWFFAGRVVIDKGIPMGAGLGGGSTDAAAALRVGARTIAEAGGPILDEDSLRSFARALGADVSFFLDPRPAVGRGIGELLEPIELPELPLVLLFPREHLSTARVYRAFDTTHPAEPREAFAARSGEAETSWRALGRAGVETGRADAAAPGAAGAAGTAQVAGTVRAVASLLRNDLEEISFDLMPELVAGKDALVENGALGALMSGSGPTLFGVCASLPAAAEAAKKLGARGFEARVATAACAVAGAGPVVPRGA